MSDCVTCRSTKSQLIISSLVVLFAIGLYAVPEAFAENIVENADGSSVPGCEPDCFIPATITINPGESVTFVNNDTAAHTSTSGTPGDGPDGMWDSSLVMTGQSYTTPPLVPVWTSEFPYFCMVHPWMIGLVIVEEEFGTPTESEPE